MVSGAGDRDSGNGSHWTLQQFSTINGKPYYALQQHNDSGVVWQCTGYRHEIDAVTTKHRITPELLDPIDEEEFYSRAVTTEAPENFLLPPRYPQP